MEKLHGMFAFAIWDKKSRSCCSRAIDSASSRSTTTKHGQRARVRIGIKSLCASGCLTATFNQEILPEISRALRVGDDTFLSRRSKAPAGHVLTWSAAGGIRTRRYWQLPSRRAKTAVCRSKPAKDLRVRLEASVSSHLMRDVPLGVFLSGGWIRARSRR